MPTPEQAAELVSRAHQAQENAKYGVARARIAHQDMQRQRDAALRNRAAIIQQLSFAEVTLRDHEHAIEQTHAAILGAEEVLRDKEDRLRDAKNVMAQAEYDQRVKEAEAAVAAAQAALKDLKEV